MRLYVVFLAFYVFDFISTLLFCSNPDQEAGMASIFMKFTNSMFWGLLIHILLVSVFWLIFIYFFSLAIPDSKGGWLRYFVVIVFLFLGIFPATDFAGATSWYFPIHMDYRVLLGYLLYLAALPWVRPLERALHSR